MTGSAPTVARERFGSSFGSPAPASPGQPSAADNLAERIPRLPQRVPAEPDVPAASPLSADSFSAPFAGSPPPAEADRADLSRIAKRLQDPEGQPEPGEGWDFSEVLNAVKQVAGVRDAQVSWNPGGVHTLRLDLVDGVDGAGVSCEVARLLKRRLGLAAEPNDLPLASFDEPTLEHPSVAVRAEPDSAGVVSPERTRSSGLKSHDWRQQIGVAETGTARPLPPPDRSGADNRLLIEHVQVTMLGAEATVEVRLTRASGEYAVGTARGPAVDAYLVRLAAVASTSAIDQLLQDRNTRQLRGRCFVEHAAVVPFGNCEVATAVVLLVCEGWVERLAGSAVAIGDPRHAAVQATLAALNRRLESLLP